jgi:hypothetical protein
MRNKKPYSIEEINCVQPHKSYGLYKVIIDGHDMGYFPTITKALRFTRAAMESAHRAAIRYFKCTSHEELKIKLQNLNKKEAG